MVNGNAIFAAEVESVPESVDFTKIRTRIGPGDEGVINPITFNAEKKRLEINGLAYLRASEKEKILAMAPWTGEGEMPAELVAFHGAVGKAFARSTRGMSYKAKLRATVKGDPGLVGNKRNQQLGELDKYKGMLAEYERNLAAVQQDFQRDHLNKLWADIQGQRAALVNPVKALDRELQDAAVNILTVEQMKEGSAGKPWTMLRISDLITILGLTCLGALLIAGLFTRFSAIMAAFMLFMFYMAMPPLPGLPEPGPEHSLIVNKNLIEVIALVAIAALPTGYWFGLDKLIARIRPQKSKNG